jgi:hypothetical protein
MPDDLDRLLDRAQATTDRQLRGAIDALGRCSDAELKAIAPRDFDRRKLEQLMRIVGDAARSNAYKARAVKAAAGLTDLAVSLAARIAKA